MAENESLDLGLSRRWHRVYHALGNGGPLDEIAILTEECLVKTINALRRPAFHGHSPQVPLAELFKAWERGPMEVERIVRQCRRHDYACLFQDTVLGARSRTMAAESFMRGICEKFFDQIEVRRVASDGQLTFGRVRSELDQVREHLRPAITRLAEQLSANPEGNLRKPKQLSAKAGDSMPDTRAILNESLLRLRND